MNNEKKIGVTVITGFLGSGKTTLLSEILSNTNKEKRIAVIENEYGTQLGVQNELKKGIDNACCVAEIFETNNGCLCCSGKQDLIRILEALCVNKDKFDYLILETTGLADPTFTSVFEEPEFKKTLYLDGIITVVDAKNVNLQLDQPPTSYKSDVQIINECIDQIAFADKIIINKLDLISESELRKVEKKIKFINQDAEIIKTKFSKIENLDQILSIKSFSVDKILKKDPGFLNFRPFRQHNSSIGSLTLVGKQELNLEKFSFWIKKYLEDNSQRIFRVKGVLSIEDKENRYVLQGVREHFTIDEHLPWKEEEHYTKIVFIGKDINPKDIITSCNVSNGINLKMELSANEIQPPSLKRLFVLLGLLGFMFYNNTPWNWETRESLLFGTIFVIVLLLFLFQK